MEEPISRRGLSDRINGQEYHAMGLCHGYGFAMGLTTEVVRPWAQALAPA